MTLFTFGAVFPQFYPHDDELLRSGITEMFMHCVLTVTSKLSAVLHWIWSRRIYFLLCRKILFHVKHAYI